ncbi:MAG: YGL010W-like membrane protein [Sulfitobacter sp.]|jgi:uncharacterized membrane protein YGL010W
MARKIEALLAEYGESHQNETNKAVHWVCVPVIVWTVMAGLYAIPQPGFMADLAWLNWLTLVLAASLVYYVFLSPTLALGVGIYAAVSYWLVLGVERAGWVVWQVALVLFILAWAGQFWGHKIEGKKPSFLKDIQFLMIGPAWLLSFIYKRVGIPV